MEGWQYIGVPPAQMLPHGEYREMRINDGEPWRERILRQVQHYGKKAPYYNEVIRFLEQTLTLETDSISELNVHLLDQTCRYIGIPFNAEVYSQMNVAVKRRTPPMNGH